MDSGDQGGVDKEVKLEIGDSLYTLLFVGGDKKISLAANSDWEISGMTDWCTVAPQSGKGDAELTIHVDTNFGYLSREVVLSFQSASIIKKMHIKQEYKSALIIENSELCVPSEGGEIEVELKSNTTYEVIVPECMKSWISYVETRTLKSDILTFKVSPNMEGENRSGVVLVKESGESEMALFTIVQLKKAAIIISSIEQIVPVDGADLDIEVFDDYHYDVDIPDPYKSWIQQKPLTRNLQVAKQLKFNISPNDTKENREGKILIGVGADVDTVRIFQTAKENVDNMTVLSPLNYHVSPRDTVMYLYLKSGIDYELVIPSGAEGWLTYQKVDGNSNCMKFLIDCNGTEVERNVQLTVKNLLFNTEETVSIVQENEKLELQPAAVDEFSFEGGEKQVKVSTNVGQWDAMLESSVDWCQLVKEGDIIRVIVAKNEKTTSRETSVTVVAGNRKETLSIKQTGVEPYIEIEEGNVLHFISQEGELKTVITTNIENQSIKVNSENEWCRAVLQQNLLVISVDRNTTTKERIGKIVLSGGNAKCEVEVIQEGEAAYLNLSTNSLSFGKSYSTDVVEVFTNEESWTATVDKSDWCTLTVTDTALLVSVGENMEGQSRNATITVQAGGLTQEVLVTQKAQDEINIYPEVDDSWQNAEMQTSASNIKYAISFELEENIDNISSAEVYIEVGRNRFAITAVDVIPQIRNGKKVYTADVYLKKSVLGRVKLYYLQLKVNQLYYNYDCDAPLLTGKENKVELSKIK